MDDQHSEDPGTDVRDDVSDDDPDVERPEFGPGGYLPDRASRRARKIILRAPLGLQWVLGALAVGVVVVVAGWLALRDPAPTEPFVALPRSGAPAPVEVVDLSGLDPLVVVDVGRPRVFAYPEDEPVALFWCAESGLIEGAGVWRPTGRGLAGTPSLREHPTVVHDGVLYADPTRSLPPLPSDDEPAATACS